MTPPGAADRAAVLPTRDGVRDEDELDVGMRLGERETLDSDPPELDDEELEPPLELELLEPELPPELDPDDPELDDPELELPRGTACAPARPGAASAMEMTRLKARRVDLAMVVTPRGLSKGPLPTSSAATLLPLDDTPKCLGLHRLIPGLSCLPDPLRSHLDRYRLLGDRRSVET
jgi:hypothetical protein